MPLGLNFVFQYILRYYGIMFKWSLGLHFILNFFSFFNLVYYMFWIYDLQIFNHIDSAAVPVITRDGNLNLQPLSPRLRAVWGTTQTSVRPLELPRSSSTQRNPLTCPSSPATTRTKGRHQTRSQTCAHYYKNKQQGKVHRQFSFCSSQHKQNFKTTFPLHE